MLTASDIWKKRAALAALPSASGWVVGVVVLIMLEDGVQRFKGIILVHFGKYTLSFCDITVLVQSWSKHVAANQKPIHFRVIFFRNLYRQMQHSSC